MLNLNKLLVKLKAEKLFLLKNFKETELFLQPKHFGLYKLAHLSDALFDMPQYKWS